MGGVLHSPCRAGASTRDKGCSGLLLWISLTNGTLLSNDSGFHHKHPVCKAPPLLPSLQDVSSLPIIVRCLGLLYIPHISERSSFFFIGAHACTAGWAGLASVPCVQLSLCPAATPWLPCSLLTENETLLLSKLTSPH